jgi:hypothetical protein
MKNNWIENSIKVIVRERVAGAAGGLGRGAKGARGLRVLFRRAFIAESV